MFKKIVFLLLGLILISGCLEDSESNAVNWLRLTNYPNPCAGDNNFLVGVGDDLNCMVVDVNGSSSGSGRTYTGISPIVTNNDLNEIALNVGSSDDWNGLFDGQEGSYYLDYQNLKNKYNVVTQLNSGLNTTAVCTGSDQNAVCQINTDLNGLGGISEADANNLYVKLNPTANQTISGVTDLIFGNTDLNLSTGAKIDFANTGQIYNPNGTGRVTYDSVGSVVHTIDSGNAGTNFSEIWYTDAPDAGGTQLMRLWDTGKLVLGSSLALPTELLLVQGNTAIAGDLNISDGDYVQKATSTGSSTGVFDVYDSLGNLITELRASGQQAWMLYNQSTGVFTGTIDYSTPSGCIGFKFTDNQDQNRNDFRYCTGQGFQFALDTPSSQPAVDLYIDYNGYISNYTFNSSAPLDYKFSTEWFASNTFDNLFFKGLTTQTGQGTITPAIAFGYSSSSGGYSGIAGIQTGSDSDQEGLLVFTQSDTNPNNGQLEHTIFKHDGDLDVNVGNINTVAGSINSATDLTAVGILDVTGTANSSIDGLVDTAGVLASYIAPEDTDVFESSSLYNINDKVVMRVGNLKYASIEPDTRIYQNGKLLLTLSDPSTGQINNSLVSVGDVFSSNKPISLTNSVYSFEYVPSLGQAGTQFAWKTSRTAPAIDVYAPYETVDINYHVNEVCDDTPSQTLHLNKGDVGTISGITANADHRMCASGLVIVEIYDGSDSLQLFPASRENILYDREAIVVLESTSDTSVTCDASGDYCWSATTHFNLQSSADGAGGDGELGIPVKALGDTYIFNEDIADIEIISLQDNVINIYDWNGAGFDDVNTISLTGSRESPAIYTDGAYAGNGPPMGFRPPFYMKGTGVFYVRVNWASTDDEITVLGYNSRLRNLQNPSETRQVFEHTLDLRGDTNKSSAILFPRDENISYSVDFNYFRVSAPLVVDSNLSLNYDFAGAQAPTFSVLAGVLGFDILGGATLDTVLDYSAFITRTLTFNSKNIDMDIVFDTDNIESFITIDGGANTFSRKATDANVGQMSSGRGLFDTNVFFDGTDCVNEDGDPTTFCLGRPFVASEVMNDFVCHVRVSSETGNTDWGILIGDTNATQTRSTGTSSLEIGLGTRCDTRAGATGDYFCNLWGAWLVNGQTYYIDLWAESDTTGDDITIDYVNCRRN